MCPDKEMLSFNLSNCSIIMIIIFSNETSLK